MCSILFQWPCNKKMKHDFDMHNFHIRFDSLFYIVLFYYWHDQFMPKFHPSWMQKNTPDGLKSISKIVFQLHKRNIQFFYQHFFKIGFKSFLFGEILMTMLSFLEDWFFSSKMCGMEMVSDMRMSDMGIKDYIYLLETTYINPQRGNDFLWS